MYIEFEEEELKLTDVEYIKLLEDENTELRSHLHESLNHCKKVYQIEKTFSSGLLSYYIYGFILHSDTVKKLMKVYLNRFKPL